jgi:hypothetical protein
VTDLERGVYEHLITRELAAWLRHVDPARVSRGNLDPDGAHDVLARHIAGLARRALLEVGKAQRRVSQLVR